MAASTKHGAHNAAAGLSSSGDSNYGDNGAAKLAKGKI